MAQETAVRGTKLLIQISDEGEPETFAHPCLINTDRDFNLTAETTENPTYNCDAPEEISWTQREKSSLSSEVTGAGRLYGGSLSEYDAWLRSPDPKNVKVTILADAAKGGGSWTGPYHLTQLQVTGGDKSTQIEVSITLQSAGEVAPFVAAA